MRNLGIVVGAVAVVVAAVVVLLVVLDDGPSPPVSVGGWSGQTMLCGYREQRDALSELRAGEVMELSDADETLAEGRCRVWSAGSSRYVQPVLRNDATYFALNTGRDRNEVTLVGVDLSGSRSRLKAEVTVPGDNCGETADYRGQLMLLIEAPERSPLPDVSIREVPLGC